MTFNWRVFLAAVVGMIMVSAALAEPPTFDKPFRIGIIGLDTSHVVAFTQIFNESKQPDPLARFRVVAAFKGGSPDMPKESADRVPGYTKTLTEKFGVKIYDTIEELCKNVDGIMLESVDGRPHLAQAEPVIKAGLPLFIDKPMAGSLHDVIEIFRLAQEAKVPCWSSSSLRFDTNVVEMKEKIKNQRVREVVAWGPCHIEKHHPDLFWYGVHGVEILYTLMGTGCENVVRILGTDIVVGYWTGGRVGVFDPTRKDYGMEVITDQGTLISGIKGDFYRQQMNQVAKFFETRRAPIDSKTTIELFAFMEGADESKRQDGKPVTIADVMAKAKGGQ
jgi:hypothetical protein